MKEKLIKFRDSLVAMAGGRPEIVGPLATALALAAKGTSEVLHERSHRKRGIHFSPDTVRVLVLVLGVLGSIVFSVLMVLNPPENHPAIGVVVLVVAHWAVVSYMITAMAGPSLLVDDDAKVLGWWPITQRELLLARLHLLLQPALEITLAMGLLPVIVYVFSGKPPLIASLSLLAGLLVQAVNITFTVAVVMSLALRIFGRRKGERMAAFLADGNLLYFYYPLLFLGDELAAWVMSHLWSLVLFPPVWFIAAGDLQAGKYYFALAGGGFLVTVLMVAFGLRSLVQGSVGIATTVVEKRPGSWHFSRIISAILHPFMRSREGWTLRLLLEQHLREDWRFIGSWSTSFLMIVMMTFFSNRGARVTPDDLLFSSLIAVPGALFIIMFSATFVFSMSYSSQWQAMWIVALGDLDSGKIYAAQRKILRLLYTVPALALFAVKAGLLGAGWLVLLKDILIMGLEIEILMTLLQAFNIAMPFGSAFQKDQSIRRVIQGFAMLGVVGVVLLVNWSYVNHWIPAYVTLGMLPVAWIGARSYLQHRCGRDRLNMDVIQAG